MCVILGVPFGTEPCAFFGKKRKVDLRLRRLALYPTELRRLVYFQGQLYPKKRCHIWVSQLSSSEPLNNRFLPKGGAASGSQNIPRFVTFGKRFLIRGGAFIIMPVLCRFSYFSCYWPGVALILYYKTVSFGEGGLYA